MAAVERSQEQAIIAQAECALYGHADWVWSRSIGLAVCPRCRAIPFMGEMAKDVAEYDRLQDRLGMRGNAPRPGPRPNYFPSGAIEVY